jgi:hypothetical protein
MITRVDEIVAAELGATIHQNGENGNGPSSVAHRGVGVAVEPHDAFGQPLRALVGAVVGV